MVQVGDVIEIVTRKIGQTARRGRVKAVRGALITVAWDSGEETSLMPAAGSLTIVGSAPVGAAKSSSAPKGVSAQKTKTKQTAIAITKGKPGAKKPNKRR